jgi:hypothetical protein
MSDLRRRLAAWRAASRARAAERAARVRQLADYRQRLARSR